MTQSFPFYKLHFLKYKKVDMLYHAMSCHAIPYIQLWMNLEDMLPWKVSFLSNWYFIIL